MHAINLSNKSAQLSPMINEASVFANSYLSRGEKQPCENRQNLQPLQDRSVCVASNAPSLPEMPCEVLEEIIYNLVFAAGGFGTRGKSSFFYRTGLHALSVLNRSMNNFFQVNRDRICAVAIKAALDSSRSLQNLREHLTLEDLKQGLRLYLRDPNNKFLEIIRVERELCELALGFFEKEKEKGKWESPRASIKRRVRIFKERDFLTEEEHGLPFDFLCFKELANFKSGKFGFYSDVTKIEIYTPFREILIAGRALDGSVIRKFFIGRLRAKPTSENFIRKSKYGSCRLETSGRGWPCWDKGVLGTLLFAYENQYSLSRLETLYQIRSIANYTINNQWRSYGSAVPLPGDSLSGDSLIISLFEKGELKILGEVHSLKSLEEIHLFMVNVVLKKMRGMSHKEITRALNLPFTTELITTHPFLLGKWAWDRMGGLLSERGVIHVYESGMSNREIIRRSVAKLKGHEYDADTIIHGYTICEYFWGVEKTKHVWSVLASMDKRELAQPSGLSSGTRYWAPHLFFCEEMQSRLIEKGESREKILEDLGLPSVSYIHQLVKKGRDFKEYIPQKDFEALVLMVEKSFMVNFFLPYEQAKKLVNERKISMSKYFPRSSGFCSPFSDYGWFFDSDYKQLGGLAPQNLDRVYSLPEFGKKWESWDAFFQTETRPLLKQEPNEQRR